MGFVFGNCNFTFSPNSCSKPSVSYHGVPSFGNGTVGTHFSSLLLRKSFGFHNRLNKIGATVSNVANGEVKVGSRDISSIEKELNFTPTFSDYVKIMESVKLDRSNTDGGSFDNNSSKTKKKPNQKGPSFKTNDDSYKEKVRPKATKGKSGGWNQVESILLDKKMKTYDKSESEKSRFNSNEKYERKGNSYSKIDGTIGESMRNKNAKERFSRKKGYGNGQQERFYQKKEIKYENHGTVALRENLKENYGSVGRGHEKYQRKSDSFGKIGATIGKSMRNNRAQENFSQQMTYGSRKKERFSQESQTQLENYGTVSMHEKSEDKYSLGRRDHEKYQRASDSYGNAGGTVGEHVRNNNAGEKYAQPNACNNGQQERVYQRKESKIGNFGAVAMPEKLKENYSFVRREHESGINGGTIVESVRIKNATEKFAGPKVFNNYQGKETKLRNFGTVVVREKSKENYGAIVRREQDAVIRKDNSVIEQRGAREDMKLLGYENLQLEPRFYQKSGPRFERSGAVEIQEKAIDQHDAVVRNEASGEDIDERAAFKTFEVFTDIRNRPRVLRMEMEERIKSLAARLNAADLSIPEWHFSKLMHDAKIRFSDHTILRVVQILGDYGNWKRALQVAHWLKSRERFKSLKSRYIYTTVLNVLGKANRPLEALNVFYSMRDELASYPDLAAYHCIVVTLGQAGLMKELFDVIDCMRTLPEKKYNLGPLQKWDPRLEPDLVVYNAVLNACVQQKQWEGVFWVLQELKRKGIRPTSTTYGLVMEVMLACGKYNLVYEFFNKVKRSCIPSALNYKVLINALWREGKIEEAVLAVKDMEQHGVVGTASLYYDLARCLCTAGRCEEALLQIDKICKVAKKPLVVTYTGLIRTCIDSDNIENARYIFNQMQNFCAPNVVTCNVMLKLYKEHKMFDEANELFNEIANWKVVPDKFTFNTMMEICVENGKFEEFERFFLQMLHHGHHFDLRKHLKMVIDAFRAGKDGVLEATWEHFISFDRVPPVTLIMERFCLKLKQGHIPSAVSCITNFEESRLQNISPETWYNLLLNNSHYLEKKNVATLLQEIACLVGSNEHKIVCENVLRGCERYLSDMLMNGLACKKPDAVNPEDFFFAGLDKSGNRSNYPWSNTTIVNAQVIPGLNMLGISIARLDYAPNGGLSPPHTHPRATEVLAVMQGALYVGFVTAAPNFKLIETVLNKGDVFVFPRGLIHFQYNIGRRPAIAFAALSSQKPDVVPLAKTVFGSNQPISEDVLETAFHLDTNAVERLQDLFWSSN